jgi:hypothetical protein
MAINGHNRPKPTLSFFLLKIVTFRQNVPGRKVHFKHFVLKKRALGTGLEIVFFFLDSTARKNIHNNKVGLCKQAFLVGDKLVVDFFLKKNC